MYFTLIIVKYYINPLNFSVRLDFNQCMRYHRYSNLEVGCLCSNITFNNFAPFGQTTPVDLFEVR